jgi:putative ABC transport system permease protein
MQATPEETRAAQQLAEATKRTFNVVLRSIAGISLLVGGIGIMNIMLASVTERTREIGIRRAIGAMRSQIIMQFLIETIVLSTTGGILGVAIGLAIAHVPVSAGNPRTRTRGSGSGPSARMTCRAR